MKKLFKDKVVIVTGASSGIGEAIVGVSSVAGFHGLPGRTGYSASKFAIHGPLGWKIHSSFPENYTDCCRLGLLS